MLQPVYVFIIFVLKRNVINVVLGRDKKRPTKSGRTKETNLSKPKKRPIIKNQVAKGYQEQKDNVTTFTSNPAFSISDTRDTESVILLSVNAKDDKFAVNLPLKWYWFRSYHRFVKISTHHPFWITKFQSSIFPCYLFSLTWKGFKGMRNFTSFLKTKYL